MAHRNTTREFMRAIGVADLPPLTSPFDPGYDPVTVESHLRQSAHLMSALKLSMACWIVAKEHATRQKIVAATTAGVQTVTGGGPFEIAAAHGELERYLDLCAGLGFSRIECGEGFTRLSLPVRTVVKCVRERGMEVQYELGKKHTGPFTAKTIDALIAGGRRWLDEGARQVVVEARESAMNVGLFNGEGELHMRAAEKFMRVFGEEIVIFEAPTKASQFALMSLFGPRVRLSNVRLEELLRVEIYRRGLHADAFVQSHLTPNAAMPGGGKKKRG